MTGPRPCACVLGSMDLVRPLGLAGIRCVVAARAGAPPRFSRFTAARLEWTDPWRHPDVLARTLLAFAAAQAEPPVLFYEEDGDLLFISRWRDALAHAFHFVVPDATLVEDLVNKERFQEVAGVLNLPVPSARRCDPATERPGELGLRFPVVLKPLTRRPESWDPVAGGAKALRVDTPAELAALCQRLAARARRKHRLGADRRARCRGARAGRAGPPAIRRRREARFQAGPCRAIVAARDQSPLQPVAPPRGRRRSQPPGPGVRGPDRRPRDQPDAHARPRGCTLVPAVGGLARGARHRPAAVALGPLGTGVRCQVGRRLGRSAPAARRRRVAPVPVGRPRYRRGVVVRTER